MVDAVIDVVVVILKWFFSLTALGYVIGYLGVLLWKGFVWLSELSEERGR